MLAKRDELGDWNIGIVECCITTANFPLLLASLLRSAPSSFHPSTIPTHPSPNTPLSQRAQRDGGEKNLQIRQDRVIVNIIEIEK